MTGYLVYPDDDVPEPIALAFLDVCKHWYMEMLVYGVCSFVELERAEDAMLLAVDRLFTAYRDNPSCERSLIPLLLIP